MREKSKWSSIPLLKSMVKQFNELRKEKAWSTFMREVLNIYKLFKQGLIVEKHDPAAMLPSEPNLENIACPARIQLPDGWFCAKNAPKIVKLPSLRICEAHLKFFKIAENLRRDFIYIDCGAEQKVMEDGKIFYKCPLSSGYWLEEKQCHASGCKHVTVIKAEKR